MKAANARERLSGRVKTGLGTTNEEIEFAAQATIAEHGKIPPPAVGARFRIRPESVSSIPKGISAAQQDGLSARAENVLKELAAELIGENPLKGRWIPSSELLRKITFRDLLTARNCGPQTIDEIVRWAKSQGVVIQPPFYAGKSLSAIWRVLVAKSSAGDFSKAEIAEALERSTRRRNTQIPIAFQNLLVKVLSSTGK